MWMGIALIAASLGSAPDLPAAVQDTIVPVERGMRLDVENRRGDVTVTAWDRDAVALEGDDGGRWDVSRTGSVLRVRTDPRGDSDLRLSVPAWMAVRVTGNHMDAAVTGVAGAITVETVNGDVQVEGGRDLVSLRTVQGEIRVRGVRGPVEVSSVNDDIALTDIQGEVTADATNGDIVLRGIVAGSVRASSMNGDVRYEGTVENDGRYSFRTHSGDIDIVTSSDVNASVEVSTFNGRFRSDFPTTVASTSGSRTMEFTLGTGNARLTLESFNGDIRLRRP